MEPKHTESLHVRIPASLWKSLQKAAENDSRTISNYARLLIEQGLAKRTK